MKAYKYLIINDCCLSAILFLRGEFVYITSSIDIKNGSKIRVIYDQNRKLLGTITLKEIPKNCITRYKQYATR